MPRRTSQSAASPPKRLRPIAARPCIRHPSVGCGARGGRPLMVASRDASQPNGAHHVGTESVATVRRAAAGPHLAHHDPGDWPKSRSAHRNRLTKSFATARNNSSRKSGRRCQRNAPVVSLQRHAPYIRLGPRRRYAHDSFASFVWFGSDVHLDRRRRMRLVRWHERQRDRRLRDNGNRRQHNIGKRRHHRIGNGNRRHDRIGNGTAGTTGSAGTVGPTAGTTGSAGSGGTTGSAGTTGTAGRGGATGTAGAGSGGSGATGSGGARGGTGGAAGAGASSGSGGAGLFSITVQLASAVKSTAPTTVGIVTWSISASGITSAHIDFGLDTTLRHDGAGRSDGDELPNLAARHEAGEDVPLPHRRERRREHVHQRRSDRHDRREAQLHAHHQLLGEERGGGPQGILHHVVLDGHRLAACRSSSTPTATWSGGTRRPRANRRTASRARACRPTARASGW